LPAAFKWNEALVDLDSRRKAAGKPHMLALVACARKLLLFANAVLARGSKWTIRTAQTNGCSVAVERAARIDAEAKAASAAAAAARAAVNVSSAEALIAHLKLAIEKMRREATPQQRFKIISPRSIVVDSRAGAVARDR
jgi:hypothetical protein